MHRALSLIIVIGFFSGTLASAEVELSQDGGSLNPKMVYVEPSYASTTVILGQYPILPYLERRPRWGTTVSVGYSTYQPVNYEPNFATGKFSNFYKTAEMPLIEAQFTVKRNLGFGSVGAEMAAGIYKNTSDVDITLVDSTLTLYPVRLGVNITLDAFSAEPLIVPYASGGLFSVIYKESQAGASKNGNSQVAPYVNLGVEIRLDGLDRQAARIAFTESGIQATYVYLEVRKFMSSGSGTDPDFGTDVDFAGGVRVEF